VKQRLLLLPLLFLGLCTAAPLRAAEEVPADEWITTAPDGSARVHLYFFWSLRCPHCQEALPVVNDLAARTPWLQLHSLEVSQHREHVQRYVQMAEAVGERARSVPGFLFCGEMHTGFHSAEQFEKTIGTRLRDCYLRQTGQAAPAATDNPVTVPTLGKLDLRSLSLPVVTLIVAGLDAFNPCAFFVLLFLLSLLAHEPTRTRMLVIGGVFVFFSGLVYFLLMAAWLNLFLLAGEIRAVTLIAGAIAIFMALVNIKDYFWFKRGVSLSIPDAAKPKLYERVRGLLRAESWPLMLTGTVALAIAANSYEALCTAGFPMVYTRLLTLQELPSTSYYGYLALYNLIYILPLLAIVTAFAWTMGTRKLSEAEGQVLKLVSGVMMLGLGTALVVAPQWLNSPGVAFLLLAVALGAGAVGYWRLRRRNPS